MERWKVRNVADQAEEKTHLISPFPAAALTAALALTMAIIAALGWQLWRSYQKHTHVREHIMLTQTLCGKIVHLDEVLTMSANMAAATADPQWEQRYRTAEPQLSLAIQRIKALVPKKSLPTVTNDIEAVNVKMVEMDNRALALVRAGHLDRAVEVLKSPEYQKQKKAYHDGIRQMGNDFANYVRADLAQHHTRMLIGLASAALTSPLLIGVWFLFLRMVKKQIRQLKKHDKERQRLLKRLEAKNKELQSVVYVASHDLRSPLVNITGFVAELGVELSQLTELVQSEIHGDIDQQRVKSLLDGSIPEALGFINAGTGKMHNLIEGLLEVCRAGSANYNVEPLDMNEMALSIMQSIRFQAKQCGASVIVEDLPDCLGDNSKTNQIFSNLLSNALKYLDPGRKGRIHVTGYIENGNSVYCVEDNGIGIAPKHRDKVFETFNRGNAEDFCPGEGLGLSIATRIVDRQDGRIWVESELGKGSRFYVSLPHARCPALV